MLENLKNSWFRCYQMGVSKKTNEPLKYAEKSVLESSSQKNKNLIKIFEKNVENIVNNFNLKDNCFFLFDNNGILIKSYIPPELSKIVSLQNLTEGSYFTEKSCGTNPVAMAMETKKSICFLGEENYCEFLQEWLSAASPLKSCEAENSYVFITDFKNENKEKLEIILELLISKINNELNSFYNFENKEDSLTEIRKNILRLSANGMTIKEISESLNLSEAAIKYHRTIICQKLSAANIVQAIARSIKRGYLRLDTIH